MLCAHKLFMVAPSRYNLTHPCDDKNSKNYQNINTNAVLFLGKDTKTIKIQFIYDIDSYILSC